MKVTYDKLEEEMKEKFPSVMDGIEVVTVNSRNVDLFSPFFTYYVRGRIRKGVGTGALGLRRGETAVGGLAWQAESGRILILEISIADEYRRRGYASELLEALLQMAGEAGARVQVSFSARSDEDAIYQLFSSVDGMKVKELPGCGCEIPVKAFQEPSGVLWDHYEKLADLKGIEPFFELSELVQESFRKRLMEKGIPFLRKMEYGKKTYFPALSFVYRRQNRVRACLLMEITPEKDLVLSFLYSEREYVKGMVGMLARVRRILKENGLENQRMFLSAVNQPSVRLIDTLLPEREITAHFYEGEWTP